MIPLHPPKHDSIGDEAQLGQRILANLGVVSLGDCDRLEDNKLNSFSELTWVQNLLVEHRDMTESTVMGVSVGFRRDQDVD